MRMEKQTARRRFGAILALAVISSAALPLFVGTAGAYNCTVKAVNPYNVQNTNNETKARARGRADCPDNSQYKELKTTLIRVVNFAPDQTVNSNTNPGYQSTYIEVASGCGVSMATRGYKSVVNFTGQGDYTSATEDLYCE